MTRLRRQLIAEGLLAAIALILGSLAGCETGPTATAEPRPTDLLHKAAAFIEAQKTFRLVVDVEMRVEAQGQKAEEKSVYILSVARPDRLALRPKNGENGVLLVSDGKQFSRGVPVLRKYVVSESPASLPEVFSDRSAAFLGVGVGEGFFNALVSDHVYERLIDDVTETRDLGVEEVDGHACRHLHFQRSGYDCDLWIDTAARPLISKVAFQLNKLPGSAGQEEPDMKMALVYRLRDWELDPKFAENEFAFTAEENWDKVDSLFGRMPTDDQSPQLLLGKPAPDFQLDKLGGGTAALEAHRGKDVVILDFWATWCPPCCEALPIIAKVAAKYRDRGVAFYAVDQGETPEEIEKFLADEKLDIPVILDRDGAVSKLYRENGIPQTVLIGKDGTVQVVHVGLIADLENRLSAELDDLLAGKDLAAEAREAFKEKQADVDGMELAWSHEGTWTGVAEAKDEAVVLALGPGGKLIKMNPQGEELAAVTIADSATLIRAANLIGYKNSALVTFNPWGPTVKAHSADGKLLWSYAEGQGVDDVWAADLNQDGLDEVIVGYNGGTGLHVLDNSGHLSWKYARIGNVWHVTAGNVDGDARPEVITTSAIGKVHIFDPAGKHLRDLDPGIYGHMVRACPNFGDDKSFDLIIVAGQGDPTMAIVALDSQGHKQWSLALAADVANAASCRDRPWVAIAIADGSVRVIDVSSGKEIAHAGGQGQRAEVAWLPSPDGEPLLVVATGRELNAFRIAAEKR